MAKKYAWVQPTPGGLAKCFVAAMTSAKIRKEARYPVTVVIRRSRWWKVDIQRRTPTICWSRIEDIPLHLRRHFSSFSNSAPDTRQKIDKLAVKPRLTEMPLMANALDQTNRHLKEFIGKEKTLPMRIIHEFPGPTIIASKIDPPRFCQCTYV